MKIFLFATVFFVCQASAGEDDIEAIAIPLPDRKITSKAELFLSNETLLLDLGSHVAGSVLNVELELVNKTGARFDVQIQPTCGCTKISTERLSAEPDGKIVFDSTVVLPPTARKFETALKCIDLQSGLRFSVVMVAESKSLAGIAPTRFVVKSREPKHILDLEISSNSLHHRVGKILVGDPFKILKTDETKAGFSVAVDFSPSPHDDCTSEQVSVRVEMVEIATGLPRIVDELITVEYSDRVKIGPARPRVTISEDGLSLPVYLMYASAGEMEIEQSFLQHNNRKMPLQLANSKKRGERVVMVTLSGTKSEWDEFKSGESIESCSVTVMHKAGFVAKTVVVVFDPQN